MNGYVPGGTKDKSEDLVDDLLDAMGELLEENTWMTQTTIELALDKLRMMIPLVAYDESILNNDGIDDFHEGVRGNYKITFS